MESSTLHHGPQWVGNGAWNELMTNTQARAQIQELDETARKVENHVLGSNGSQTQMCIKVTWRPAHVRQLGPIL